jgi:hypothetical protein
LLAGDARHRPRRIGAQEFEAARLRAAESLHFENDAILGLFANADNPASQIAFVRPQVNEGILAFSAQLAVQAGKLGQPLAVFANFRAAGRRHRVQGPIELGPFIHRQTVQRLENSPADYRKTTATAKRRYCRTRPVMRIEGYC